MLRGSNCWIREGSVLEALTDSSISTQEKLVVGCLPAETRMGLIVPALTREAVAAQQMISGLLAEFRALASAHAFF